jgi:hypothetical protein
MAKGPEITDEVKMLIAKLHEDHPKWTNEMIRNEVTTIVHKKNSSLPKGWPSKFAIDRIMPSIRERAKRSQLAPNPIDQPWTVQSMGSSKYQIPPEALPSVLRVWLCAKQLGKRFSIRDARWVGRLYVAIRHFDALYDCSVLASLAERTAEMAGIEDFMGNEAANLLVYSLMTDRVFTREEAKIIAGIRWDIGPKGTKLYLFAWDKELSAANVPKGDSESFRTDYETSGELESTRKGGPNERQYKAKRQK